MRFYQQQFPILRIPSIKCLNHLLPLIHTSLQPPDTLSGHGNSHLKMKQEVVSPGPLTGQLRRKENKNSSTIESQSKWEADVTTSKLFLLKYCQPRWLCFIEILEQDIYHLAVPIELVYYFQNRLTNSFDLYLLIACERSSTLLVIETRGPQPVWYKGTVL